VKFLRELDFSIKEIRSIPENCEEDTDMVDVLRDMEAELSRKIDCLHYIEGNMKRNTKMILCILLVLLIIIVVIGLIFW
jgi:hypothetical protein